MRHECPSEWNVTPLSAFVQRVERKVAGTPEHVLMISSRSGFVPQSEKYSRFMAGESLQRYVELHSGEFAYNRGNSSAYPYGCIYRLKGYECAAVPFVYSCFSVNEEVADPSFLEQLFGAGGLNAQLRGKINSGVRNNGLLNIRAEEFFSCEVALPGLAEQRKIAAILSSIDLALEARRKVIEQLRLARSAMMSELLTKGTLGRHVGYSQTEIGVLPQGWETPLLDQVARRGSGHTPSKSHPEYWGGEIKWVSLTDSPHLDRLYLADTSAKIAPDGIANSSAVEHPAGTVILSRDGSRVGKSAITTSAMAVSQHFITWTCGPKLDNHFLYYVLQSKKPEFARVSTGSTTNRSIGLPYFKALRIPLPSLPEQQLIGSSLRCVDVRVFEEEAGHTALQRVKAALASALLTGETRVRVSAEAA